MISEYKEQKKTESINSRQAEKVTKMHTARKHQNIETVYYRQVKANVVRMDSVISTY